MAATKVDTRPPSTFKDQLSGSFSGTASSMSGQSTIISPKLSVRRFGGFSASPSLSRSTTFQQLNHVMYKAASFPANEGLGADFDHNVSSDETTHSSSEVDECCKNWRANGTSSFNRGAVFGLFGAFAFHPSLSPFNVQSGGLGKIGLVNLHQFNPTPLLFPVLNHQHTPKTAGKDSLLVPTLSQFEVKCSPQLSECQKDGNGVVSGPEDRQQQLCQHDVFTPLSENKTVCETSTLPCVKSSPTSKELLPEEAISGKTNYLTHCDDKAARSDDEIPTAIHSPLNKIHDSSEDVASSECCYTGFDGDRDPVVGPSEISDHPEHTSSIESDSHTVKLPLKGDDLVTDEHCELRKQRSDFDVDGDRVIGPSEPTGLSDCPEHPSSTEKDSHTAKLPLKVDHLAIDGHCELRKLLSDESGFFETSSPCDLPAAGLNGWWQQDCLRQSCWDDEDEDDEMDWDEEDSEGGPH